MVVRLVLALGIVGMIEASQTWSRSKPVDGAARVHYRLAIALRSDPARADAVEVAPHVVAYVGGDLLAAGLLGAGAGLARYVPAKRLGGGRPTHELDAVEEHREVGRLGSERKPSSISSGSRGSGDCSRTAPVDAGFIT
jgi:hypothetical protein